MKKKCKFGHPLKKENRKNGKCGTCIMAKEFRQTAEESGDGTLKKILTDLAILFEKGDVVYDTKGRTLSQIADDAKSSIKK